MVNEDLKPPISSYVLTADLSRNIDQRTTAELDIDGFTLMEVAGSSAAKKWYKETDGLSHGIYLCGKGNNGGDALVMARYLLQKDIAATLVFISGTDDLSPDSQKNLELIKAFDDQQKLTICTSWNDFSSPSGFDFIVDGMLGTGLDSEVRGDYTQAVQWANKQPEPTLAMDISTGLDADSGSILGCAIQAKQTFAFGGRKQGFYLNDGPPMTGKVEYCELPFPNKFKQACSTFLLNQQWASVKSPTPGRHKYDSGVLYILAGSEGLTGAAIMAAKSAWAESVGAVILLCPRGLLSIYENNLPNIIKKPLGKPDDLHFKADHAERATNIISQKDGPLLIGPGLGRANTTAGFLKKLLTDIKSDAILDADALWGLSQLSEWPNHKQSNWILTPHPGELSRLITNKIGDGYQRLQAVQKLAQQKSITILSKGMPSIIATPSGSCYITDYDTRYFNRAGNGDVLAGKVAALVALNHEADKSCAGALLKGEQKLADYLTIHEDIPKPTYFI